MLENFGKYVERREFTFTEGSITLIKGRSGIGKTTIFKGVLWALYGTIKGYRNHKHPNKRTYVCFSAGDMSIERAMPYELKLHYRNLDNTISTVTGESAQSEIYKRFGVEDAFRAACFRQQQSQNILMDGSSANKLSLMKTITFGSEDSTIDPVIEKIASDMQKYATLSANATTEHAAATARYQGVVSSYGDISKYQVVTAEQVSEWQRQYQVEMQQKSSLDVQLGRYNHAKTLLAGVNDSIAKADADILALGDTTKLREEVNSLNSQITSLTVYISKAQNTLQTAIAAQQKAKELTTQHDQLKLKEGDHLTVVECNQYPQTISSLNAVVNGWNAHTNYTTTLQRLTDAVAAAERLYQQSGEIPAEFIADITSFKRMIHESISIDQQNSSIKSAITGWLAIIKPVWKDQQLPTVDQLTSIKKRLQEYLLCIDTLNRRKEWEKLKDDVERLKPLENFKPEELTTVSSRIYDLEKQQHEYNHLIAYTTNRTAGGKLQACPKCAAELMVVGGSIITPEQPPPPPDMSELPKLKERLVQLTTARQHFDEYIRKLSSFNKLAEPPVIDTPTPPFEQADNGSVSYLVKRIDELVPLLPRLKTAPRSLEWDNAALNRMLVTIQHYEQLELKRQELDKHSRTNIQPPTKPYKEVMDEMSKLQSKYHPSLNYHQQLASIRKQLDSINIISDIEDLPASIKKMEEELDFLRRRLDEKIRVQRTFDMLTATRAGLLLEKKKHENEIKEDIPTRLEQCTATLNKLSSDIHAGQCYLLLANELKVVNEKKLVVDQMNAAHQRLSRLLTYANNADYGALQEVIDSINNILPQLISTLFDTPITVRLDMYKEMKAVNTYSQGRIVSKILLVVTNDDEEFSPVMLSGGEQDRISFALTITLNKIMKSPIIMLDEAFSSLCNEDKITAMQLLRSQCPGTTILSIVHDGIDGLYDHQLYLTR